MLVSGARFPQLKQQLKAKKGGAPRQLWQAVREDAAAQKQDETGGYLCCSFM